jgi:acyl-CoA synthetase (AMP-forming)/AMP-acid ligase II
MINAALTLDSMSHCLKITHPKVVICDANVANLLAPAADKLKALGVGNIYSFHPMDHLPNRVPVIDPMNLKVSKATLDGVIAGKGLQGLVPDSDGTVFFTSGTTGYPKAVLSSQRAGLHNLLASYVRGYSLRLIRKDTS